MYSDITGHLPQLSGLVLESAQSQASTEQCAPGCLPPPGIRLGKSAELRSPGFVKSPGQQSTGCFICVVKALTLSMDGPSAYSGLKIAARIFEEVCLITKYFTCSQGFICGKWRSVRMGLLCPVPSIYTSCETQLEEQETPLGHADLIHVLGLSL